MWGLAGISEVGVAGEPSRGEVAELGFDLSEVVVGFGRWCARVGWGPLHVAVDECAGPAGGVDVAVVAPAEQGSVGFGGGSAGLAVAAEGGQVVGVAPGGRGRAVRERAVLVAEFDGAADPGREPVLALAHVQGSSVAVQDGRDELGVTEQRLRLQG